MPDWKLSMSCYHNDGSADLWYEEPIALIGELFVISVGFFEAEHGYVGFEIPMIPGYTLGLARNTLGQQIFAINYGNLWRLDSLRYTQSSA